jgi:hypothetical protein
MELAEMNTKTVDGYFGPKQVTREAFTAQWVEHFQQVYHLADTPAEFTELRTMRDRIAVLAGQKWDGLK